MPSFGHVHSPNVLNYYIGKGIVSVKLPGDSDYVDCGNVPTFEFLCKVTKLDHYSSRTGTKVRDFVAITQKDATLTMVLEEWTGRNLGMAFMGLPLTDSPPGEININVFSASIIEGAVKFVGTNDFGARFTAIFPKVQITPNKAVSLIGDKWGDIDLTGDVLADPTTGFFGSVTASMIESP